MDINAAAGSTQTATAANASAKGMDSVTGYDFMNLLIKQLQMQDPFEPMGNEEMVNQISTIRELEMNTRMSERLERLTEEQRFGAAAALIGKYVYGAVSDEDGNAFPVEGQVTSIRFNKQGEAFLELDSGEQLPLAKLERVTNAPEVTPEDVSS